MIYALVGRGAVVVVPSYRSPATGSFWDSASFDVLRCAVSYARAHADELGGDPERVVLVGQSHGSWLALQTTLEEPSEPEACLAAASTVPDAVIGLAGFGLHVGEAQAGAPPMWLVAGGADHGQTLKGRDDMEALEEAGYDATYHELDDVTHHDMFDPEATPEVVDIIFDMMSALDR